MRSHVRTINRNEVAVFPDMKVVDEVGTIVSNSISMLLVIPAPSGYYKLEPGFVEPTNHEVATHTLRTSLSAFAGLLESLMRGNDSPPFSELDQIDTLCASGHARTAIRAHEDFKDRFCDEHWWREQWPSWNEVFQRFIGWLPEEYRELAD
jgi:hypothetical protein